jgi:diguanylate cyclase (GGDEF)-like protein
MGIDPAQQRKRTFSLRLLVWSFLATHVPLLTVAVYAVLQPDVNRGVVLGVLLIATLTGTALLLLMLDRELQPLELATRRLHRFLDTGRLERGGPYPARELGDFLRDVDATCVRLDDARRTMEHLANEDLVTGVLSRRASVVAMDQALAAAEGGGGPVAVALVDIDDFKAINDAHGHPAGDRVLHDIADVLRGDPSFTAVGRWGGDEFLVLLATDDPGPRFDASRAELATRLHGVVDRAITLSVGVTVAAPGASANEVVALADEALYAAKAGGRDRVVVRAPAPG